MSNVVPFPLAQAPMPLDTTNITHTPVDDGAQWGDWMARAQRGDTATYQSLLAAIVPYVRAIARRRLGDGADIDDAVQEVLILVHDIRHTYEPRRAFKPWLGTIASRRCIDLARQRTRRARREVSDDDSVERMHHPGDSPEQALAQLQRARTLHQAVDRLAPKMRHAVRRVHFDSDELNGTAPATAGALKVACHRALKSLKAALAAEPRP